MGFAALHHLLHQGHGFGGDAEAWQVRCKAGHTQDANGVFAKGGGDVPERARFQVAQAVKGIDAMRHEQGFEFCALVLFAVVCVEGAVCQASAPCLRQRHGVDSQVAARQIFLKRDFG